MTCNRFNPFAISEKKMNIHNYIILYIYPLFRV